MTPAAKTYAAAVVGAGPAGLAVVARLLDKNVAPVAWIDPAFAGGRLRVYPEVPSNTKVGLFLKYARASPTLVRAAPTSAFDALQRLDQDRGCDLTHAQTLCADLAAAVAAAEPARVAAHRAWVSRIDLGADGMYALTMHPGARDAFDGRAPALPAQQSVCTAASLYLCTGSEPVPEPPAPAPHAAAGVPLLDLDTCLTPSRLAMAVSPSTDVVGVVGTSHSAVLCVKNLCDLGVRVVNFIRHPLKYAVYMPDGWIRYDNTGLKGMAAEWAKEHLESDAAARQVGVTRVQLGADESATYAKHLPQCTRLVYAIGYRRRMLPSITIQGKPLDGELGYNNKTAQLMHGPNNTPLPNAYGLGIAFPELVTDPEGNVELSVGMWKFMRYVQDVL